MVLTARPPFLFPLGQLLCKKDPRAPATKTRTKIEQVKAILYYYRKKKTPLRGTCTRARERESGLLDFCCCCGQGEKNKIKIYTQQQQKSFKKKKKKKGKPHQLIRRTFPLELFFSSSSYSSTQPKNIISFRKKKKNI